MFLTLKLNRNLSFPALVFFLLAAGLSVLLVHNLTGGQTVAAQTQAPRLVIGVDGGAISIGGAKESHINLDIALRMEKLAQFYGCDPLMTRREDRGAMDYGAGEYSEHRELVRRSELANAVPDSVLISVHQNNYPTAQPKGAQVLYAPGEDSRALGLLAQSNLIRFLDPDNRRVATPGGNIYLLTHAAGPAILVECGFMSNFEELEKLLKADYQISLAAVLTGTYFQYVHGVSLT